MSGKEMNCFSGLVSGRERAKVFGSVFFCPPGQFDVGVGKLDGQFEKRKGFVIFEVNVKFWLGLPDKIVLEKCGLSLRVGQNKIEIFGFRENVSDFGIRCGEEVRFDPVSQGPGFSDIDNLIVFIFKKIYAGFFRQILRFFF